MSSLRGVKICPSPLTRPVAVNTVLALPRSTWWSSSLCCRERDIIAMSEVDVVALQQLDCVVCIIQSTVLLKNLTFICNVFCVFLTCCGTICYWHSHLLSMLYEENFHNWCATTTDVMIVNCLYNKWLDVLYPIVSVLFYLGLCKWSFYELKVVCVWSGDNCDVLCVSVSKAMHNIQVEKHEICVLRIAG